MREFRLLNGVYYKSLFGINRMRKSNDPSDRRKLILYVVLAPLLVTSLVFSVGTYCVLMAQGLNAVGDIAAMPTTMFAVASIFMLVTVSYKAADVLLAFKDYDMMLSLPIPVRTVAFHRLYVTYTMSLLFALIILVPAGAVYAWFVRPEWTFYPIYIILTFASPILPTVLGAGISVLIKNLVARLRGARFFNMILLFTFTLGYMFIMMRMNMQSFEAMGLLASNVSGSVSRFYPPAKLFFSAVKGDIAAFALLMLLYIAVFAAFAYVLGRYMRSLHAYMTERRARRSFRMRNMRVSSAFMALFKRELGRYFASAIYVMNTGFGPLISIVLSIVVLFSGGDILASLYGDQFSGIDLTPLFGLIPYLLSFLALTCCVSASSVSLEGKQVWITQSLPVRAIDIWHSKLAVNGVVLLPFCVITPLVFTLVLKPVLWVSVAIILTPTICGAFTALFGLMLNQKHHSFDWKNETQVVKQSMPVSVCIMGGMVISFGIGALSYFYSAYAAHITFAYLGALALASVWLYISLRKNAEKRLRAL